MSKVLKAIGIGVLGAGIVVGSALGGAALKPTVVEIKEVPVPGEPIIVPQIVEVTKTVIIPGETVFVNNTIVDDSKLDYVLDSLEERGVIEDAKEIVQEIESEDKAIADALEVLDNKENLFDMLEEANIVEDEDEVRVVKIYNDFEDIEIVKSDYDNKEYEFNIKIKVEDVDNEVKKYVICNIAIEDGEVELVSVSEE